ncbi:hypothetical protein Tco_0606822, partial [Tanacetum coccineum]
SRIGDIHDDIVGTVDEKKQTFSWLVECEVQAQIRCIFLDGYGEQIRRIFLDGYGVMDVRTVRIMKISKENGQSRTNTDTGKERVYKSGDLIARKDKIQLKVNS